MHVPYRKTVAGLTAGLFVASLLVGCGGDKKASNAAAGAPAATSPAAPAAPAAPGAPAADQSPSAAAPAPGAAAANTPSGAPAAGPGGGAAASGSGSDAPKARTAAAAPGAATSGGSSGGGSSAAPQAKSAASGAPVPGGGAAPVPGAPAPSGSGGPKSEIVLGAVGVHSGVIGDILAPIEHGARAWSADVNDRGGVNGHKVRLIIADDGGDPGRAVSIGRKLIEQDKIVAFYAEQAPGTLQAYIPLAEKAGIPIFGACSCNPEAAKSKNMFAATLTAFQGMNWSHTAMAYKSGAKKVAIFYCREVAICSAGAKEIESKLAPSLGMKVVYTANISMASPDYSAEMLSAKNAGAEAIITYVENPTTLRIIRSGKRQGYTPKISSQMSFHDERALKIGKEDAEGVMIGASMWDWNDPKMADFKAAMAKYVPDGILASFSENPWVAGKLIEVLAKSWPDQNVTGADVIKSLYALRGETLGGLVPPLTFDPDNGNDRVNLCAYPTVVKGGKFVQEKDMFCQPDWKPVTR
jgi:branched-chain amino acid transport system substrate-binding protein